MAVALPEVDSWPSSRGAQYARLLEEQVGRGQGYVFRVAPSQRTPYIQPVAEPAKRFEAVGQQRMLPFHGIECQRCLDGGQSRQRIAKRSQIIVDQGSAITEQIAMLAADRAPDERAIARVEFLDAVGRLDDLGTREAESAFLAHDDGAAACDRDAHSAETAV